MAGNPCFVFAFIPQWTSLQAAGSNLCLKENKKTSQYFYREGFKSNNKYLRVPMETRRVKITNCDSYDLFLCCLLCWSLFCCWLLCRCFLSCCCFLCRSLLCCYLLFCYFLSWSFLCCCLCRSCLLCCWLLCRSLSCLCCLSCFDYCLCTCETCCWYAEWRARYIVETASLAKLD